MADSKDIREVAERLDQAKAYLHIDEKREELAALDEQSSKPGFWDDAEHAQQVSKRASSIRDTLAGYDKACGLLDDAQTAFDLADDDPAFHDEACQLVAKLEGMLDAFEVESWFDGEFDEGDCIININPGSGGLEAQDWTQMLYHLYLRYAESKGWKTKVLDIANGEVIGIDRASIQVEGRFAYGMLKSETGVHRLVRISPTDEKKRRHTTFASVEVVPLLPDEVEVDLNPADVNVDVYRSSGPGGQGVNTTDSAVRLTHVPTGIVVTCQNERSQLMNKEVAFRVLRARLYDLQQRQREEELAALTGTKMENSFGSQIRNYVLYPYQMVKDLRSGEETGNVDAVLDGDIDAFVLAYHRWRVANSSS